MLSTGFEWLDRELAACGDVTVQELRSRERRIRIAYVNSLVNVDALNEAVIPFLQKSLELDGMQAPPYPLERFEYSSEESRTDLYTKLFSGYLLLFEDDTIEGYALTKLPGRQPEESSSEVSVKGPKDGFVEELAINLGLVRKRLRTPDLKIEKQTIGTTTRTEIALLYLESEANPQWVAEARKRLSHLRVRAVNGAAQVEEMLADRSVALFPLLDYAGRPDSAVDALLNGRLLFMLEGSPMIFLAPVNLLALLRSPEDNYMPYYFVTLEKLIRVVSLVTTIFLPGFWVSVSSFNIDQIPFPLLSTIVLSRIGLPMSANIEMLLMLALFEVFREAGVRLPRAVGQTVAVVGGIIVGDAAIEAGLSSPTMLVVSSLTAVSSYTLVNQSLSGAVTIARLFVLVLSMTFGMFGFFVGVLALLMYLSSLRSFGAPYLMPLGPVKLSSLPYAFMRPPAVLTKGPYKPNKGPRERAEGDASS